MIIAPLVLAMTPGVSGVEASFAVGDHLPQTVQVARLMRPTSADSWRIVDVRDMVIASGKLVLVGSPGDESLVVVRAPGLPGYLLHGPFRWPPLPTTYHVSGIWRRTVRGHDSTRGTFSWVSPAADSPDVVCGWTIDSDWECLGVPRSASGVLVRAGPAGILYSIVRSAGPRNDVEQLPTTAAFWGRLLIVQNTRFEEASARLVARALRLYKPASRPNSTRFDVVPDGLVRVEDVAATALWVTGVAEPAGSWLEVVMPGVGTARVEVDEIASGPPDALVAVQLESAMTVSGRVSSSLGAPVAGAVVSLYRLGKDMRMDDRRAPRRQRIAVSERRTNDEGSFEFPDLAPERYEMIVLHPQFGRTVRQVEPHAPEIQITLKPPPMIFGRVLTRGAPRPGVPVEFVPDLHAFAAADDVTELRGGEDRTDDDGRFRIFAAARPGELRIGPSSTGIRRVALAAADRLPPVTDLGDIELNGGATLTIVFEQAGACEPLLTGPAGGAGLSVVRARRDGPAMFSARLPEAGRWNIAAICSDRERAVEPPAVEIAPDQRQATVVLRWRVDPTP